MTNTPSETEKIGNTLTALKMSLQESWRYFIAVNYIADWFSSGNQFNDAARFFDLVSESCIRSSISTLAGLISNNKDTINFHYFLNIANHSLNLFQFSEKSEIEVNIQKHRNWLEELTLAGAIGNRIIDKRDKIVAHLDRKFVTQKNTNFLEENPPINSSEIENVYKQLMNVINDIESFYYDRPFVQNELDLSVKDDIEYIFNLLRKTS